MSDVMQAKAIRQAAQTISIAIFCAALTMSCVMPIAAVLGAKVVITIQAKEIQQWLEQSRPANRSREQILEDIDAALQPI